MHAQKFSNILPATSPHPMVTIACNNRVAKHIWDTAE